MPIDLSAILKHLPERKIADLELVTTVAVETGLVEMVILYGSYARGDYHERPNREHRRASDFDMILVTASDVDGDSRGELRAKAGTAEPLTAPLNILVKAIDDLNEHIIDRAAFYMDAIIREGIVLYDSGRVKLADPPELSPKDLLDYAESRFTFFFERAKVKYEFHQYGLKRFEETGVRDFLDESAFNLHQTAELCYKTIEEVFALYSPKDHRLRKLRKRVIGFDPRITEVFAQQTPEEQKLFFELDYSYIGARYKRDEPHRTEPFVITEEMIAYWSDEVTKLLRLTETVCKDKLEELRIAARG